MAELGIAPDNAAIAAHYAAIADAMLIDGSDAPPPGLPWQATATLMHDEADKVRVARAAMALARSVMR
jgi:LPPG:FO 2-phospho-L-lactate transferase